MVGRRKALELADGVLWSIRAEGEGIWSPEQFVPSNGREETVRLPIFPTGQIQAKVQLARIGEMPSALRVRFQPSEDAAKRDRGKAGELDCPITEGLAQCSLPAGKLDLRISGTPYSPVYRLGTEIEPQKQVKLAPISLVRGASISGFVTLESGEPAPTGTSVHLSIGGTVDPRLERRLKLVDSTEETDAYGFFQFLGLRPGQYTVVAEADGFAPARIGPIEARADLESSLVAPLVLATPITLDLSIEPPRDPWQADWDVDLSQVDPGSDRWLNTVKGTTHDGQCAFEGLAPGTYHLAIKGAEKSQWLDQTVELETKEESLLLQIPLLRVEGSLVIGDEPAAGVLWFGARHGSRRVQFALDEDGRFQGALPAPGHWRLEWVPGDQHGASVALPSIDVPDKPKVTLDLEVPDTHLVGEVVDRRGDAVPGATVTALGGDSASTPSRVETDEDGRFSLAGLEPGSYAVKAERASASSSMVPVDLAEGRDAPELRLVLQETKTLYGRVETGGRGIAGARITVWPNLGSSAGVSFLTAVSGPDGLFHVEAPADEEQLNVLTVAPGFGTRLANLARSGDGLLVVELEPNPGSLQIGPPEHLGPSVFLVHDGAFLSLRAFLQLSQRFGGHGLQGSSGTIPGLDPGNYAICRGAGALNALRSSVFAAAPFCNYGFLPPSGELSLAPPDGQRPPG